MIQKALVAHSVFKSSYKMTAFKAVIGNIREIICNSSRVIDFTSFYPNYSKIVDLSDYPSTPGSDLIFYPVNRSYSGNSLFPSYTNDALNFGRLLDNCQECTARPHPEIPDHAKAEFSGYIITTQTLHGTAIYAAPLTPSQPPQLIGIHGIHGEFGL